MRHWIQLVEAIGTSQVPADLYHGTSLQNYLDIRASNRFEEDSSEKANHGFSTTESLDVAMRFARWSADDQYAVVITINGPAIAAHNDVTRYRDGDTVEEEHEWVVTSPQGVIENANSFIQDVEVIDLKGDPTNLLPWDEALYGVDRHEREQQEQDRKHAAVQALMKAVSEPQAKAELMKLAATVHPGQEAAIADAIDKLVGFKLYEMLILYQEKAGSV